MDKVKQMEVIPQDEIDAMLRETTFSQEEFDKIIEQIKTDASYTFNDDIYYSHIADWCNSNKAYIESISPEQTHTYHVVFIKEKALTDEERLEQLKDTIVNQLQYIMDAKAREKGYDNGFAIASYSTSTDGIFKSEAEKFIAWRDKLWRYCYTQLDLFIAGKREFNGVEEFISEMPTLEWED